ncbi:selenocysteine-specific translation elongation factor [Arcobacter sp. FWKO B]|uniref:selenocysteine-specific translation elongation factor n=1 Tax=Arcobacter sp. FWKO B TaxID=2593672 RepID=UPI0018A37D41|nr:selenocysteine-specific translation elongation factor [Arcobacter sp. FWKO B]QOG11796.1 selenocysteine-specific translation elongation factor [Arcobacter sp. FWKO B]
MTNLIIGTIGHIDHGKTSLVKALSGFDGDSTAQEKQRGMTLDISFSHLKGENKSITFVDVPGHEDLIKNMIAGAFSLDASMLVVSAVEGIKPQTVEHLQICKLLGITNILAVITKADLITDEERLDKSNEVKSFLEENNIQIIDILAVSIYDENSIKNLANILFGLNKSYKKDYKFFRYFIDRAFTIKGSGTVVTGTVLGGEVTKKDKLYICDIDKDIEIRAIQTQHSQNDSATLGTRVALNLANIDVSTLQRGQQIIKKGYMRGFKSIDVEIELLDNNMVLHDNIYQFFIGSSRCNVKVLELELNKKTNKRYATISSTSSIFAMYGDRFVLRNGSSTIGGGKVLNPIADPMKKAQKLELLELLSEKKYLESFMFLSKIHKKGFGLISSVQRFGLSHDESIEMLSDEQELFVDKTALVVYEYKIVDYLENIILNIYKKNPYALISAHLIHDRFKWASVYLADFVLNNMVAKNFLVFENGLYMQKDIKIENISNFIENKIYQTLHEAYLTPEAPYNIYDMLDLDRKNGDKAFKNLTHNQKIKRLAHNYFITTENLIKAKELMKNIIKQDGYIDIHNFKTHLNVSRKYLISLLDYLDTLPDIKKLDNQRFLVK